MSSEIEMPSFIEQEKKMHENNWDGHDDHIHYANVSHFYQNPVDDYTVGEVRRRSNQEEVTLG